MGFITGSPFKAVSLKHVKKQFPLDENRRNTYKQFHASAGGREPSVLSTFDAERKQLMAVCITLLPILLFHSLDRKLRPLIAMHEAHAHAWANKMGTA